MRMIILIILKNYKSQNFVKYSPHVKLLFLLSIINFYCCFCKINKNNVQRIYMQNYSIYM